MLNLITPRNRLQLQLPVRPEIPRRYGFAYYFIFLVQGRTRQKQQFKRKKKFDVSKNGEKVSYELQRKNKKGVDFGSLCSL